MAGTKPAFDEVHIVTVEDEKTAELAFEAGDLEVTAISRTACRAIATSRRRRQHRVRPGTFWTWLGMNTEHPSLADIRVRQAVQHAVDVEAIMSPPTPGSPRAPTAWYRQA